MARDPMHNSERLLIPVRVIGSGIKQQLMLASRQSTIYTKLFVHSKRILRFALANLEISHRSIKALRNFRYFFAKAVCKFGNLPKNIRRRFLQVKGKHLDQYIRSKYMVVTQ
jgi:hypothetical protein